MAGREDGDAVLEYMSNTCRDERFKQEFRLWENEDGTKGIYVSRTGAKPHVIKSIDLKTGKATKKYIGFDGKMYPMETALYLLGYREKTFEPPLPLIARLRSQSARLINWWRK